MLEHAFRAERLLREAATELQLGDDVFRVMKKVDEASRVLRWVRDDFDTIGMEEYRYVFDLADKAASVASHRDVIERGAVTDKMVNLINEIEGEVKRITGRRCTFFDWDGERRSLAAWLNDLAACVHHLAIWLTEKAGIRKGVCIYVDPKAPSWARDLCLELDDMARGKPIEGELLAVATDKELQVRTGDPGGYEYSHAVDMYIKKANGEFEVEWYPKYEEHDKIAEEIGLKRSDMGFKGKLSLEALKKLFKEIIGR